MNFTKLTSLVIHNYFDASAHNTNLSVMIHYLFSLTALDDVDVLKELEDVFEIELWRALPKGVGNYSMEEIGSIIEWEINS